MKTTNDLIKIAAAGGGMTISSQGKTTNDLIKVAAAASNKGARIFITSANSLTTNDLIRVAAAGKGCVTFDLQN